MFIYALPRGTGKTRKAVEWLVEGTGTNSYPGWTRVLVVHSVQAHLMLRNELRNQIPDIDHRLFNWKEWCDARAIDPDTEVLIDELEMMFPHIPGRLVGFTITADVNPSMP